MRQGADPAGKNSARGWEKARRGQEGSPHPIKRLLSEQSPGYTLRLRIGHDQRILCRFSMNGRGGTAPDREGSMTYQIIRSGRKTLSLEISPKGVLVRAPYSASPEQIERFVRSHAEWIAVRQARLEEAMQAQNAAETLTGEELRALADRAAKVIPERVAYYAPKVGTTYGRITIRNQKTKWGSCSARGNLNFNCLLMLTPPEVLDSVVVHELCHRKEMNHSKQFYEEVLRVFPDYWKWNGWLKQNGAALMSRMTGDGR